MRVAASCCVWASKGAAPDIMHSSDEIISGLTAGCLARNRMRGGTRWATFTRCCAMAFKNVSGSKFGKVTRVLPVDHRV